MHVLSLLPVGVIDSLIDWRTKGLDAHQSDICSWLAALSSPILESLHTSGEENSQSRCPQEPPNLSSLKPNTQQTASGNIRYLESLHTLQLPTSFFERRFSGCRGYTMAQRWFQTQSATSSRARLMMHNDHEYSYSRVFPVLSLLVCSIHKVTAAVKLFGPRLRRKKAVGFQTWLKGRGYTVSCNDAIVCDCVNSCFRTSFALYPHVYTKWACHKYYIPVQGYK